MFQRYSIIIRYVFSFSLYPKAQTLSFRMRSWTVCHEINTRSLAQANGASSGFIRGGIHEQRSFTLVMRAHYYVEAYLLRCTTRKNTRSKYVVHNRPASNRILAGAAVAQQPAPNQALTPNYLDVSIISTFLNSRIIAPGYSQVDEHPYHNLWKIIFNYTFPVIQGYAVIGDEPGANRDKPDIIVIREQTVGPLQTEVYDLLYAECKAHNQPYGSSLSQLQMACEGNSNESRKIYAMLQIGLRVWFYRFDAILVNNKYNDLVPMTLQGVPFQAGLHTTNQAHLITAQLNHIKTHPLPLH